MKSLTLIVLCLLAMSLSALRLEDDHEFNKQAVQKQLDDLKLNVDMVLKENLHAIKVLNAQRTYRHRIWHVWNNLNKMLNG